MKQAFNNLPSSSSSSQASSTIKKSSRTSGICSISTERVAGPDKTCWVTKSWSIFPNPWTAHVQLGLLSSDMARRSIPVTPLTLHVQGEGMSMVAYFMWHGKRQGHSTADPCQEHSFICLAHPHLWQRNKGPRLRIPASQSRSQISARHFMGGSPGRHPDSNSGQRPLQRVSMDRWPSVSLCEWQARVSGIWTAHPPYFYRLRDGHFSVTFDLVSRSRPVDFGIYLSDRVVHTAREFPRVN